MGLSEEEKQKVVTELPFPLSEGKPERKGSRPKRSTIYRRV
jgi:hypothetical protein